MPRDITDSHTNFLLISILNRYKVIIIPTGFITVDAFSSYIKSIYLQVALWKKILVAVSTGQEMDSPGGTRKA